MLFSNTSNRVVTSSLGRRLETQLGRPKTSKNKLVALTAAMADDDFYCRYYVGHKGKFGHEVSGR